MSAPSETSARDFALGLLLDPWLPPVLADMVVSYATVFDCIVFEYRLSGTDPTKEASIHWCVATSDTIDAVYAREANRILDELCNDAIDQLDSDSFDVGQNVNEIRAYYDKRKDEFARDADEQTPMPACIANDNVHHPRRCPIQCGSSEWRLVEISCCGYDFHHYLTWEPFLDARTRMQDLVLHDH
jgi:hypothetical protein